MDRVYPSGLPEPIREGWDTYAAESLEHLGRFQIVGLLYQVREPRGEGGRESLRMILQNIEPALLARSSFRALWVKEDFVAIHTMLPWEKFRLNERAGQTLVSCRACGVAPLGRWSRTGRRVQLKQAHRVVGQMSAQIVGVHVHCQGHMFQDIGQRARFVAPHRSPVRPNFGKGG